MWHANWEGMANLRIEWAALCFSSQGTWSNLQMVIREKWVSPLKWMEQSHLLNYTCAKCQHWADGPQSPSAQVFWYELSWYFPVIPAKNQHILRFHFAFETYLQRSTQVKFRAVVYFSVSCGSWVEGHQTCLSCLRSEMWIFWSNFLQQKMFP